MDISLDTTPAVDTLVALFRDVFTASEGAAEGATLAQLVEGLLTDTPRADLRLLTARTGFEPRAAIAFSRLRYGGDTRRVFLLSPVAVATAHQGQGIGQRLIQAGLDTLRADGVDLVTTYGDPAFYSRVGFVPVDVAQVPAPHALSQPIGWQAQSLGAAHIGTLAGPAHCVAAFDDPNLW